VTRWDPYVDLCFEVDEDDSFSCHVEWVDVIFGAEKRGWVASRVKDED